MFKDKDEALRRLEAELLRQEQTPREPELAPEDSYDYGPETDDTYRNYANRYGGYQAYNGDPDSENMQAYFEEVYRQRERRALRRLSILAVCLLTAIFVVLAVFAVRFLGFPG